MVAANEKRDRLAEPAILKVYAGLTAAITPLLHLSKPLLAAYGGFKDSVPERLGEFSPVLDQLEAKRKGRSLVWIHAVSVGEAAVAGALMEAIRSRRPDALIAISTTTFTGRDYILRNMGPDGLFFFPLDLPGVMNRLVDKLRPDCFVDVEVELWPNCLRALRRAGVPMALANGRISDRAVRPPAIWRNMVSWALSSFDALFMRSREDVDRAVELGAPENRTYLAGNLKFAAAGGPPEPEKREELRTFLGVGEKGKLLVAGSTHPGEDEQVLEAWQALNNGLIPEDAGPVHVVLAPRHLEQVERVVGLVRKTGNDCVLWTDAHESGAVPSGVEAVVVNTIGELIGLYGAADAAFVGGSLVTRGGHNVLEPVAAGVPTLHGPSMQNFHDLVQTLGEADLLREVANSNELAEGVRDVMIELDLGNYRRRARELIGRQLKAADMIGDWVAANLPAA